MGAGAPPDRARRSRWIRAVIGGPGPVPRPGFLPGHRRRRISAARARAGGDAPGGNGAGVRGGGAQHSARDSRRRAEPDSRQHRDQPRLHQSGDGRRRYAERRRWRPPGTARAGPSDLDVGVRAPLALDPAGRVSRCDVFLRACGHREPGREHAGAAVHGRPGSRPGDRADPAPGREQSPHLTVVQRANSAQFLAQSAEWRQLQRRRAHAYLQAQLARSAGQHTGDGAGSGRTAAARQPRDRHAPHGVAVVNHYNTQPVADVYAAVDDRDLGAVAADVDRAIAKIQPTLPKGMTVVMRGQVTSMRSSFSGLLFGVLFAMVLVYLLLVINFQSWLDPLVIVAALPGALAGVVWMLFATHTTLSVPALMGTIMALGVATANSVLLITFANEQRAEGHPALQAALSAGFVRLRPVCMTALAMIIGMLPMALALGEGGEQNAPLGRAVIGGLLVATGFTLVVVPVLYSVLRAAPPKPPIVIPEGHV